MKEALLVPVYPNLGFQNMLAVIFISLLSPTANDGQLAKILLSNVFPLVLCYFVILVMVVYVVISFKYNANQNTYIPQMYIQSH